MCVEPPWERVEPFKVWVGATSPAKLGTSRPGVGGVLLSGQALAGREKSGTVERGRELVNSVDLFSFSRGQLKTWN
jgi:hypothetical protein